MSNFTTNLITTLIDKGDITELFRSHVKEAVNKLLQIELTEFLNYDRYDRIGFNSGNSRNGFYDRSIKTEYGELNIRVLVTATESFLIKPLSPSNVIMTRLNRPLFNSTQMV